MSKSQPRRIAPSASLVLLLVGCAGAEPDSPPSVAAPPALPAGQPPGWAEGLTLPEARDLSPDPRVVEVTIVARVAGVTLRPGTSTDAWTYNGGVPGPLIRAHQGDRLLVHFINQLPEPTTIHWHGLRIPAAMDGVPDHSQPAVRPGESFDYDFTLPDVGLFWYHPHLHSAAQLGDGLYGALLVEEARPEPAFGDEVVLVLSDAEVDDQGRFLPEDSGGNIATLFGREGTVVLVNGRVNPVLQARVGVRQRWRVVNAAKSRYFFMALEGNGFTRIGGDGGLLSEPVAVAQPLLTPGERADLVIDPRGTPGTEIPLRWVAYDRGFGTAFRRPDVPILTLRLSADAPVTPSPLPPTGRTIEPLSIAGATPVDIRLTRNDVNKVFQLGINGEKDGGPPLPAHVGETQVWTVTNTIDWDHPFHLHGFFFQVLDDSGAPRQPIEWKDTVNVPVDKHVKLAVRYDDRPGMWMFHCHILDHAEAGMMGTLKLDP
jgi:FtsP/CotA-like multicopper oxidase with cupredoxin domain